MKGRMQKISTTSDNFQGKNRTASYDYQGVQTFIGITENNLKEVRFTRDGLLEQNLSPRNSDKAYKQVVLNKGSGGIDGMETKDLLPSLTDMDEYPHEDFDELYHYRWNQEEGYKLFKCRAEVE